MKRDGCTRDLAEAKIGSQMPQESKRRRSQYVIDNSGSHSSTRDQACHCSPTHYLTMSTQPFWHSTRACVLKHGPAVACEINL